MAEPTYEDYKRGINIQEVLRDAGYHLNRRDGLRYPTYVRLDSDGRRVRGDKFIVTANGLCCFQPPERKNYNVISFIKEHPDLFREYTPGMSKDRLVNLVCRRLMNMPEDIRNERILNPKRDTKPFDIYTYELQSFNCDDWESQKKFYPYFKNRGISLDTQRAFAGHFFLATKERTDGKKYTNLSFPLTLAAFPGKEIVGLEERSRPNSDGKTTYKGMAAGSNASEGLWIGRLNSHRSDRGFTQPIGANKDVYWFESAFDAMAFYQIEMKRSPAGYHDFGNAVYVSTGGNPSVRQLKSMLEQTPDAIHHLCFDNDKAGQLFSVLLAVNSVRNNATVALNPGKDKLFVSTGMGENESKTIDIKEFDFGKICKELNIDNPNLHYFPPDEGYKDWNDQLMDKKIQETSNEESNEQHRGFRR